MCMHLLIQFSLFDQVKDYITLCCAPVSPCSGVPVVGPAVILVWPTSHVHVSEPGVRQHAAVRLNFFIFKILYVTIALMLTYVSFCIQFALLVHAVFVGISISLLISASIRHRYSIFQYYTPKMWQLYEFNISDNCLITTTTRSLITVHTHLVSCSMRWFWEQVFVNASQYACI